MQPSTSSSRAALPVALLLAAVAVVAFVAGGVFGRGLDPSPPPGGGASAAPSVAPSPTVVPSPTLKPTDGPSDGPFSVDLDIATDHDVSVVIDDETGTLTGAASGRASDGMSVRWLDVKVENLDAETVRVVWVGLPRDEEIGLTIAEVSGTYQLRLIQAAPPANSDALGFDRILDLRFDRPVSAADVEVTVQEGPASDR